MPYITRDLPSLFPSSAASTVTQGIGSLDDASTITVFISSAGGVLSSTLQLQIAQFDPNLPFPQPGVTQSSAWYTASTAVTAGSSSLVSFSVTNISFRGLRLLTSGVTSTATAVAFVSKQISV